MATKLVVSMALMLAFTVSAESYIAPAWLPGGHLQTIYAVMLSNTSEIVYRRERWDTPDHDFIDLDWVIQDSGDQRAKPLVVLFHGLEGNSRGHYALSFMNALKNKGWQGVVAHFRGCSGEPNRLARSYHAGDAQEIDWILRRLKAQQPQRPLFAVGVSLGGNALLKWLGEQGDEAKKVVAAAVAVSAPVDLRASGDALGEGFNLVYTRRFLQSLKSKSFAKLERFPRLFDREAVEQASTLREFDNLVTAPLHGFRDTDDYWERASSKPGLKRIRVPALLINARNDPFLPAQALPGPEDVAASVTLEFPEEGGHVGFVLGPFPGNLSWLPKRIIKFFENSLPPALSQPNPAP